MENIKITKTLGYLALSTVIGGGASANIANTTSSTTLVRIYSGTPPTASQLNTLVLPGTISDKLNPWAANLGATMLWDSYYHTTIGAATTKNNGVQMPDSAFSAAKASGTATWFLVASTSSTTTGIVPPNTSTIQYLFIGTITDTTGDGDLRLTDTNLVAGSQYKIGSFHLNLPYESYF